MSTGGYQVTLAGNPGMGSGAEQMEAGLVLLQDCGSFSPRRFSHQSPKLAGLPSHSEELSGHRRFPVPVLGIGQGPTQPRA